MGVESKLKLFESIVMPILLYGSEIWGFDNTCNVEKNTDEILQKHLRTS